MQAQVDLGHWEDDGTIYWDSKHRAEAGLELSGRGMISIIYTIKSELWHLNSDDTNRSETQSWGLGCRSGLDVPTIEFQLSEYWVKEISKHNEKQTNSTIKWWSLYLVAHPCEGDGKGWLHWENNWNVAWHGVKNHSALV